VQLIHAYENEWKKVTSSSTYTFGIIRRQKNMDAKKIENLKKK
jgi:hypothetical protein